MHLYYVLWKDKLDSKNGWTITIFKTSCLLMCLTNASKFERVNIVKSIDAFKLRLLWATYQYVHENIRVMNVPCEDTYHCMLENLMDLIIHLCLRYSFGCISFTSKALLP